MAKQKNAPPTLHTLVGQIKAKSKVAGTPVLQMDMAAALKIGPEYFSSLIKRDREGKPIPDGIVPALRMKYAAFLKKDVAFEGQTSKEVSKLEEEVIRLRAQVAYLMNALKVQVPLSEWKNIEATVARDEARQLDAIESKGSFF